MLPPGINFIKASNVFFALLHDYAPRRYEYYKTILPWFQKQFLVNYSATELPEHLKSGGIPPFSGCVHDTNTACLSAMQLLLLFLEFLVRLRTVFSLFRIRKDISAGY